MEMAIRNGLSMFGIGTSPLSGVGLTVSILSTSVSSDTKLARVPEVVWFGTAPAVATIWRTWLNVTPASGELARELVDWVNRLCQWEKRQEGCVRGIFEAKTKPID